MPLVELEPTVSAGERPQTYALDSAATGTGNPFQIIQEYNYFRITYGHNLIYILYRHSPFCILRGQNIWYYTRT